MASVKVAVRVRPFLQREIDADSKLIIRMQDNATGIVNYKDNGKEEVKYFTYDHSYWSHDHSDDYVSQEQVYNDLGGEVVECAFLGFNACVFAYGQTGSGKTFTMMGSDINPGLIPRICKGLFDRMAENSQRGLNHQVSVTYYQIYNEKVTDLLSNISSPPPLKVREQPNSGPYVEGLSEATVQSYEEILEYMQKGNTKRTTARTKMNDSSSRSHAIFTIRFVRASFRDTVRETVSKIHLVDLAGSERANATGAEGQHLLEGAFINKSLVTLGQVISQLAKLSSASKNGRKSSTHVPYRDSTLTWLLKDSLGGNSKTIMIAAISPAECSYGETISTLRYANRAKEIVNKPRINEDPNVRTIRELRAEIARLKAQNRPQMLEQIQEKETLEKALTKEWTAKWAEARAILQEQKALALRKAGHGVVLDSERPHLIAIDDDPLSTGVTLYPLNDGETTIGTDASEIKQDIVLNAGEIESQHCSIISENGVATIHPKPNAHILLNTTLIESPTRLTQGCIIVLARTRVFRYNNPAEAAEMRKNENTLNLSRMSLLSWSTPDLGINAESFTSCNEEGERCDLENKRLSLAKDKEIFEREQVHFEQRKKDLAQQQALLEDERLALHKAHLEQTRQLELGYQTLAVERQKRELELNLKEEELLSREKIQLERRKLLEQIAAENAKIKRMRELSNGIFTNVSRYILENLKDIQFPDIECKRRFDDLSARHSLGSLTDDESEIFLRLLRQINTGTEHKQIINRYLEELGKIRISIDEYTDTLNLEQSTIQKYEEFLKQQEENPQDFEYKEFKQALLQRSQKELKEIESRKQSLTLNLKKINSVQSPDSCEVNCNSSSLEIYSPSSDTYHTATSGCSIIVGPIENPMSDSGVELRIESQNHERNSNFSSDDDAKGASDSQSTTSSVDNFSRDKRQHALRKLLLKINHQKRLVMDVLGTANLNKAYIDRQISVLTELQQEYMALKYGSVFVPVDEHPLQDGNGSLSSSPSPVKPIQRGSTSHLETTNFMLQNQRLSTFSNYNLHRSMPSISIDSNDSIVTITGYFLRGAGKRTHYEYEVRITTALGEWWSVLRRYSRFRDLHLAMKARYGEKVSQIPFPPRQFFANSESVAQSRKRQLETYLSRLIEVCKTLPACPLTYSNPISKADLIRFSPFFSKGVFESSKFGTS